MDFITLGVQHRKYTELLSTGTQVVRGLATSALQGHMNVARYSLVRPLSSCLLAWFTATHPFALSSGIICRREGVMSDVYASLFNYTHTYTYWV